MELGWVEHFRAKAIKAIQEGAIVDFEFSGPTYHIEFFDKESGKSYYPFLQFAPEGNLKDAFCSCHAQEKGNGSGCLHLAAAYIKIFDENDKPWHQRFAGSFWLKLCEGYADRFGYNPSFNIINSHEFSLEDAITITSKNLALKKIQKILFDRPMERPENSIKFSNLSSTKIERWRQGRADPSLLFELSLWSDLAKWLFWLQSLEKNTPLVLNEEIKPPLTEFFISFEKVSFNFMVQEEQLPELVDRLDTINASLNVQKRGEKALDSITFDEESVQMTLHHVQEKEAQIEKGQQIGYWLYVKHKGFFSLNANSLLDREILGQEEITQLLQHYPEVVKKYLINVTVIQEPVQIRYKLSFDSLFNLHIDGYLFEPGDCDSKKMIDFGTWLYLRNRGFYRIEGRTFSNFTTQIAENQVPSFLKDFRLWLNEQKGFETHLSSIESRLIYEINSQGQLRFNLESQGANHDTTVHDFGEWVYLQGYGFYSKRHTRAEVQVRAGVVVEPHRVSHFILENREELENIKGFFSTELPLKERGLKIFVKSQTTIVIEPTYRLQELYQERRVLFYDEFLYVEGLGFCEIPFDLRLPEDFAEVREIQEAELTPFFYERFPKIRHYFKELPVALQSVHKCDLEMVSLVRNPSGGVKAGLHYVTEFGRLNIAELQEALEKGYSFLFSQAGLIELKKGQFDWIAEARLSSDSFLVELSTLDFLRLDVKEGIHMLPDDSALHKLSQQLLHELRTFTHTQPYDLMGLKSELRLYQQTGLKWLWFLYLNGLSGLLCDEMGLGKTHQAMALLCAVQNFQKGEKPLFLVVCPTSVIYHWQDKLATFLPKLELHLFHGAKRKLKRGIKSGVIITSYGIARLQKELFSKLDITLAIFDEVQVAKNAKSRLHHSLRNINAGMRLGLTGTPIENNLLELKALFDLVLPGYMPKESLFRAQYLIPIERGGDDEKKAQLSAFVRPFIMRRRKAEVLQELPAKVEDKTYCDLSEEQYLLYKKALDDRREAIMRALEDPSEKVPYLHIFSLLASLKQICDHPALFLSDVANYKKHQSHKWELFVELMDEAFESQQKVVIFSQYLQMLDIFELYLKERGIFYAQIRGATQDRRAQLERFQGDERCRVFIGSLQAAGLGIDLTAASVLIMYDRWWNLARESQAIDRVHRIGQKWPVAVYKLITKGTIEEKIDQMIERKGRLMEEVIISEDQATLKSFSREELIDLLSLT